MVGYTENQLAKEREIARNARMARDGTRTLSPPRQDQNGGVFGSMANLNLFEPSSQDRMGQFGSRSLQETVPVQSTTTNSFVASVTDFFKPHGGYAAGDTGDNYRPPLGPLTDNYSALNRAMPTENYSAPTWSRPTENYNEPIRPDFNSRVLPQTSRGVMPTENYSASIRARPTESYNEPRAMPSEVPYSTLASPEARQQVTPSDNYIAPPRVDVRAIMAESYSAPPQAPRQVMPANPQVMPPVASKQGYTSVTTFPVISNNYETLAPGGGFRGSTQTAPTYQQPLRAPAAMGGSFRAPAQPAPAYQPIQAPMGGSFRAPDQPAPTYQPIQAPTQKAPTYQPMQMPIAPAIGSFMPPAQKGPPPVSPMIGRSFMAPPAMGGSFTAPSFQAPIAPAMGGSFIAMPAPKPSCAVCGKPSNTMCGGCNVVAYCSGECQKQDWPSHKAACNAMQIRTPPQVATQVAPAMNGNFPSFAAPTASLCAVCARPASTMCGGCNRMSYCSTECQTQDWPSHQAACNAIRMRTSPETEPRPARTQSRKRGGCC